MTFELTVLGNNSAQPAYGRHPSAHLLNINETYYLIDCGEGTQMQLYRYGLKISKIKHIFISHLHGDHFLGLLPLLDSYNLSGRVQPLHLYGPPLLQQIIDLHLSITNWHYNYELVFHPITADQSVVLLDNKEVSIKTIILDHRLPCTGFLFAEKMRERKMRKDKIEQYQIPYTRIPAIKQGADFITVDQQVILHDELTISAAAPRSYAYCSDTAYTETILPIIQDVDLLYHEATYLSNLAAQAIARGHATAWQAATIAQKAKAKYLLLGHFSSRYVNLTPFTTEARTVFAESYLAEEGKQYRLQDGTLIITDVNV